MTVLKDRVVERTQGCWNCIHSNDAAPFWLDRRLVTLTRAAQVTKDSPFGEEDQKVVAMRRMVATVDRAVGTNMLMRCTKGVTANNEPVGDLVAHSYLCSKWSGREGASLARAGAQADKLPEELFWDREGSGTMPSITSAARAEMAPKEPK